VTSYSRNTATSATPLRKTKDTHGLIWLRTETSGGLLWTWYWTLGFHKMRKISWLTEQPAVLQEWFSSVQSVIIFSFPRLKLKFLVTVGLTRSEYPTIALHREISLSIELLIWDD
jgi:hypothetical protein